MNKKVFQAVEERSQGYCEECGRYVRLHKHHAFGASNRKKLEMKETVFDLCYEDHEGDKGCHGKDGHEMNLKYKRKAQKNLLAIGWTKEQIIEAVGRWYLD